MHSKTSTLFRFISDSKSKIFFILFVVLLTLSCNKKGNTNKESTIFAKENYSDLLLDQDALDNYFEKHPENDSIKKEVFEFYKKREYQFAWFNKNGMTEAVPIFYSKIQNYGADFDNKTFANAQLDSLIAVPNASKKTTDKSPKNNRKLELLLTTTFFKYSNKVYGGIDKNPHDLAWFIPRKKKNYQAFLNSLVVLNQGDSVSEPLNKYYVELKAKLIQYRAIAKNGGFPVVKTDKKLLSVTEKDSCLIALKQHLFLSGDLKESDTTIVYTKELAKAVAHFQNRMGLRENGKLNESTLAELNQPIDFRIKQMMVNLERLRWIPAELENEYLLVNIPEYKLHVIDDHKLSWTGNVVVGKNIHRTTIFSGSVSRIVLNPYWNVPNSIIMKEIIPHIKRNPNYLENSNMEIIWGDKIVNSSAINWDKYKKNVPFIIRQKPGNNNSLGRMKFLFPNQYSIYLHDTPSKSLFSESKRAFSHGCIRVENPKKLLMHFLRKDAAWTEEKVDKILKTDKEFGIRVKPTVPVYIVYFTSWVNSNGELNFRNDIYNLDKQLENEIFQK